MKLKKENEQLKSEKNVENPNEEKEKEISQLKEKNEDLENKLKEQTNLANVYAQYIEAYKEKVKEFDTYVKQINIQYEEERGNYLKEIELLKGKVSEYEKKENNEN